MFESCPSPRPGWLPVLSPRQPGSPVSRSQQGSSLGIIEFIYTQEGKAGKLCRKLRTMQSVVMARTYADKASLRVSELLLRPGNKTDTSASAAPVCFSLESALINLRAVCY